jgi:outer membrane protein assembly factor BamB
MWVAQFGRSSKSSERAKLYNCSPRGIALDTSGNVCVTGRVMYEKVRKPAQGTAMSRSTNDYVTIKYDSKGNELWVSRFHDPSDDYISVKSIAVDNSGHVYLAGSSGVIKYDPNGVEVWLRKNPKRFNPEAMIIDCFNNVYVTGGQTIIKYKHDGSFTWKANNVTTMAVDGSGNVYTAGVVCNFQECHNYITAKYDENGNKLWSAQHHGPKKNYNHVSYLGVDTSGSVYVVGYNKKKSTRPHVPGPKEVIKKSYITIKYDSNGNELWIEDFSGPEDIEAEVEGIEVNDSGIVYLIGVDYITKSGSKIWPKSKVFILKQDTNGNQLWLIRCPDKFGIPYPDSETDRFMALDNNANIYVTGCGGIYHGGEYVTIKYAQKK